MFIHSIFRDIVETAIRAIRFKPAVDRTAQPVSRRSLSPLKLLTAITLLLGIQFGAFGTAEAQAVYHVRAGAAGTQSGADWNNAFSSLPATLVRGATYYVAGGSYKGYTFDDAVSGSARITIRKATSADHGSSVGWQAAYGTAQAQFGNLAFRTGFYTFDGVTGGGPGSWETGLGFKVQGTFHTIDFPAVVSDIAILHTDIQGGGRDASSDTDLLYLVNRFTNITISHCFLHDVSRTMILTWPAKGNGFLIEYSKFARNGSAEHREAWSAGPDSNVVVRYNLFEDILGTGVIAIVNNNGDATNWDIYGNVFYHTGKYNDGMINSGAIVTRWDGAGGPISVRPVNWRIYNNAFVNIGGYTSAIVLPNSYNSSVYNNIWYSNRTNSTGVASSGQGVSTNVTANYNWYYANSANNKSGVQDVIGASNPFVNWQAQDFRLAYAIPGLALSAPFDYDPTGSKRGSDGVWDRGPYEFGGTGTAPPLSTPSNMRVVSP